MNEPEKPKPRAAPETAKPSAEVVPLERRQIAAQQPDHLSEADALRIVRLLAVDSANIVVIPYGKRRTKQRKITRPQIEKCVRLGTIQEGPFLNQYGNWQFNLFRHAAGEQVTCVVAIEWATRVLVINAF
jgi:hypothetical protein